MNTEEQFQSFRDDATRCLVDVTRTAGQLSSKDLNFLRTTDPAAKQQLDRQIGRILNLTRRLCRSAAQDTDARAPNLPDLDAFEDNWRGVVDLVDHLLEKADGCLDELKGVIKKQAAVAEDAPVASGGRRGASNIPTVFHPTKLPKPQKLFQKKPRNDDTAAFKPLLRTKPHAVVPLEQSLRPQVSEAEREEFQHPYQTEVTEQEYPPSTFVKSEPIPFTPFESTNATYVDSPEAVAQMLEELKGATEIAVDLEHHDTHSYIGIVCLMQISTRDKDWIVDTLKPWREDLQVLNEVFADPRILKVFHGAAMDIIWLQRDLGLYVVSLFDTYDATNKLHYPKHSLAYLLEKLVNFKAQKQYQLADWRIRPIPQQLLDYARSDTHFLLYIYDCMRNELLEHSNPSREGGDLVAKVLRNSRQTALQRYERPFYDAELGLGTGGWYTLLGFSHKTKPNMFTREQFAVYRAVHAWRDRLARRLDESPFELLNKPALFNVAREMPTDAAKLAGLFAPAKVPVLLQPRMGELAGVVRDAKARGTGGPDFAEVLKAHPSAREVSQRKQESQRQQQQDAEAKRSVSAVLQRERETPGTNDLQAATSRFWGPTLTSGASKGRDEGRSPAGQAREIRLHVPIPALTAEVFSSTAEPVVASPSVARAPPEHAFVRPEALGPASTSAPPPAPAAQDDIIVLQAAASRSRKRKAPHDAVSASSDNSDDEEADGPAAAGDVHAAGIAGNAKGLGKRSNKALKKARNKARRRERLRVEQQQAGNGGAPNGAGAAKAGGRGGVANGEEAAFDYASAPSVLNAAPRAPAVSQKGGKKNAGGGYNPYAKSLNAPKGPKGGKQKGHGKSATFKG